MFRRVEPSIFDVRGGYLGDIKSFRRATSQTSSEYGSRLRAWINGRVLPAVFRWQGNMNIGISIK